MQKLTLAGGFILHSCLTNCSIHEGYLPYVLVFLRGFQRLRVFYIVGRSEAATRLHSLAVWRTLPQFLPVYQFATDRPATFCIPSVTLRLLHDDK